MKEKKPLTTILFKGIQIKSLEKAQKFCEALNIIEEEVGIYEVEIGLEDVFFCPWIDIEQLNKTPMERLVRDLVNQLS